MDEQTERRQNWTCEAHHELVESLRDINNKLDKVIDRQIAYSEISARIEEKQERLEKIVTNGLTHSVADLSKRFNQFCEEAQNRFGDLEDFQWFQLPVTKFRDKIFWSFLKIVLIGGGVYFLIYYGDNIMRRILP